jgi:hypothetical protein
MSDAATLRVSRPPALLAGFDPGTFLIRGRGLLQLCGQFGASFFVSRKDVLRERQPTFVITSRTTALPRRMTVAVSVHFTPLILIVNLIPSGPPQLAASFIHDRADVANIGVEKPCLVQGAT